MGKCNFLVLVLLFSFSSLALSEGDPILGKEKSLICTECHGITGISSDKKIPKLAGQLEGYIIQAVIEFQQGVRKDPMMSNLATVIRNEKDLEDIAAYFAMQPKMQGPRRGNIVAAEGAELFTSERCNYCHTDEGKRYSPFQESIPPIIGGQHKPYLIKAMKDIKAGKRPADAYDLMVKLLDELTFKEIEAIAEYLSQI